MTMSWPAVKVIDVLARRPDAEVNVPGSKSLTNRALLCAALADGATEIVGGLEADDTDAMAGCLRALGAGVDGWTVLGRGHPNALAREAVLNARLSGTTARFLLPVLASSGGRYVLDGDPPLRARPMTGLLDALVELGAAVAYGDEPGRLPVTVGGGPLRGGVLYVPGDVTSQFVSALLMAGPYFAAGLQLRLTADLVSAPYVAMTRSVMEDFGAPADGLDVGPGRYRSPGHYRVEPDASAASYFFAVAALTGGRVTVAGLGPGSVQGDLGFVDLLERMGAVVERAHGRTTVVGTGTLRGIDVDLREMPDVAPTLAAVAVFAEGPTTVRGVGFIRGHETDRISAVVHELRRAGIDATETDDGFVVHPGPPRPARIETYDDHRIAMAFSLLGLRSPGIEIANPACVAKTFPGYFEALDGLRR
ncbi:MAG: 3-phosphoshikimate 1-carboxyvinyltransferase [Acidimicrobiia bacterium]